MMQRTSATCVNRFPLEVAGAVASSLVACVLNVVQTAVLRGSLVQATLFAVP